MADFYCYFPEKSVLDFRFRLCPHKLSGDRDLMRIILPWEKSILQQFIWKNFYAVYCQSFVSNPARLSILTAYEIDFRRVSDFRFSGQTRTADFVATLEKESWWYFVSSKSFHTNFNHSYPNMRMVPDNLWEGASSNSSPISILGQLFIASVQNCETIITKIASDRRNIAP